METKECKKCDEYKPLSAFRVSNRKVYLDRDNGKESIRKNRVANCRGCENILQKARNVIKKKISKTSAELLGSLWV